MGPYLLRCLPQPLLCKSGSEFQYPCQAFLAQAPASGGLHAGGQSGEFDCNVIQTIAAIVQWTGAGERISGVGQRPAQLATHAEHACNADGAECIQPVRVLHDLGFDGLRRNACRKAVCLNCMGHGGQFGLGKAFTAQNALRFVCRHARGLVALWVVFGQIDAVVQPARGLYDLCVGMWVVTQQGLRSGPDAGEVGDVVGGVAIDGGQNNAIAEIGGSALIYLK